MKALKLPTNNKNLIFYQTNLAKKIPIVQKKTQKLVLLLQSKRLCMQQL